MKNQYRFIFSDGDVRNISTELSMEDAIVFEFVNRRKKNKSTNFIGAFVKRNGVFEKAPGSCVLIPIFLSASSSMFKSDVQQQLHSKGEFEQKFNEMTNSRLRLTQEELELVAKKETTREELAKKRLDNLRK